MSPWPPDVYSLWTVAIRVYVVRTLHPTHGVLPQSPGVIPAQCKPVRGHGCDQLLVEQGRDSSTQRVAMFVVLPVMRSQCVTVPAYGVAFRHFGNEITGMRICHFIRDCKRFFVRVTMVKVNANDCACVNDQPAVHASATTKLFGPYQLSILLCFFWAALLWWFFRFFSVTLAGVSGSSGFAQLAMFATFPMPLVFTRSTTRPNFASRSFTAHDATGQVVLQPA